MKPIKLDLIIRCRLNQKHKLFLVVNVWNLHHNNENRLLKLVNKFAKLLLAIKYFQFNLSVVLRNNEHMQIVKRTQPLNR